MSPVSLVQSEEEILKGLAHGKTYRQVRGRRGTTQFTLMKQGIWAKLGAESTLHAVAIAAAMSLIAPESRKVYTAINSAIEVWPELPEVYRRAMTYVANGDTYPIAAQKVNVHPVYLKKIVGKIRSRVGVSTSESLVAVLAWAELVDVVAHSRARRLDETERFLLHSIMFGLSAKQTVRMLHRARSAQPSLLLLSEASVEYYRGKLCVSMGAATWYHAVALGIRRGELEQTPEIARLVWLLQSYVLTRRQEAVLSALVGGASFEQAGQLAGSSSPVAHSSALRSVRNNVGVKVPRITYFAALIWARKIPVA